MLRDLAPAKVNLTLRIPGRFADGYHAVDSVVVFARSATDSGGQSAAADGLTLESDEPLSLSITGHDAQALAVDDDNLILRAARAFAETYPDGRSGAFRLEKVLPVAAGIGGGSSDAAAALRLLATLNNLTDLARLRTIALPLGADVPVCVSARAQHMAGIGDVLRPLPGFPPLPAVLVNPRIGVSTAAVFESLGLEKGTLRQEDIAPDVPELRSLEAALSYCANGSNDMQDAALSLCPVIGECLDAVTDTGAALARMSGSGATVFGLYRTQDEANAAARAIADRHPGWWVAATTLN
jgi:4-diphosphocytidyl-2-C-methyl-D-erythritol kinase